VIASLIDIMTSYVITLADPRGILTIALQTDFYDVAKLGDMIDLRTVVTHVGPEVAYAT
jgi:acyl-coenzyme A thioesterase PaaI-like protein